MSRHIHAETATKSDQPTAFVVTAADGALIPVTVMGSGGPVIILIHGWSCNQTFWQQQGSALAGLGRVVTLDLPGHGSAVPSRPSGAWSMAGFGADVVSVADAIRAEEVVLVGHSMGGAVAIEAAIALGDRCRLLVGVDTFTEAAFYTPCPADEIRARRAMFEADFAGTMRGMIGSITAEGTDPVLVDWIGAAMASADPAAALGVLEALLAWDIEARWPHLAVPVVALNSGPLARRNELITLPRLDVRLIEGVGHFPMLEEPRIFNTLLVDLLQKDQR